MLVWILSVALVFFVLIFLYRERVSAIVNIERSFAPSILVRKPIAGDTSYMFDASQLIDTGRNDYTYGFWI